MEPTPQTAEPHPIDPMSSSDFTALVDKARTLQRAAEAGTTQLWLRGKKFGLLCGMEGDGCEDAALLARAADELGAQVAHVRPGLTEFSAARDVKQTAHMLGRLYDVVVCKGMAPALVKIMRVESGVPVYDRITSPNHPIAIAAEMLGSANAREDNRRFVLQALLLKAMA